MHTGSLQEANSEALLNKSARDKRMLAIYIHHDQSIFSNVYCSQTLCAPAVVEYLNANYVVWAWDVTHQCRMAQLLSYIRTAISSAACADIEEIISEYLRVVFVYLSAFFDTYFLLQRIPQTFPMNFR